MRVPPASASNGRTHLFAVLVEEGEGRARRGEQADVDALRGLGEELAQRLTAVLELEARREVPAGEMDVRASRLDRPRDRGQRGRPVDERRELVAGAGRGIARGPRARRGVEGVLPADPPEPSAVARPDGPLDAVAEEVVDALSHRPLLPARLTGDHLVTYHPSA